MKVITFRFKILECKLPRERVLDSRSRIEINLTARYIVLGYYNTTYNWVLILSMIINTCITSEEERELILPLWEQIKSTGLNLSYSSHFLDEKTADKLFQNLETAIVYFTGSLTKVKVFGKWHDIPRQQVAFGDEGLTYKFSSLSVPAQPWPDCLLVLKNEIAQSLGTDYNFVLVNRYRNGNDYMGEHRDDEKELDEKAGIVSISLGATRDFVLRHSETKKKGKNSTISNITLKLEHGSCLVMNWPTNRDWYHSLPRRRGCHNARINLTFRKIKI